MPTDATQQEREAFEAVIQAEPGGTPYMLRRRDAQGSMRAGEYVEPAIQLAWRVWLACRASLPSSGELVEALTTIAQMDPDGVRADDLGRAAGIARAALSAKEPKHGSQ